MPSLATARIGLGISAVMIGIGVYLGTRMILPGRPPITGTSALDIAFAFFFIARGALQVRRWRQTHLRIDAERSIAGGPDAAP